MTRERGPLVCFVLLNWNQTALTIDCLTSLAQQDYGNFRVLVIDNGSTAGSAGAIRSQFPQVELIELPENIGYSPANNLGIKHALAQKCDYVFLLNNDTTVDSQMLTHLVAVAESDASIGMTGPTMLYYSNPEIIWSAGASIDWRTGAATQLDEGRHLGSIDNAACRDVDYITSCAVCIKKQVFEDVGLMDERYFIYYEEADLSIRASAKGWRSVHVPWARMWHKVSATMGETSPATEYYMNRNAMLFLAKNQQGWPRLRSLMMATSRNLLAVAAYTFESHHGGRLPNRTARLLAIRDAMAGRWGRMGSDVAVVCHARR